MSTPKKTVLEFCEETKILPPLVTVTRTTTSKYLFYLLVRHYRQKLKKRPEFLVYTKDKSHGIKSQVEEHSVLDEGQSLYVLEGFPKTFVNSLQPPTGTYILAETDDGEIEAPPYSFKMKRDILKILLLHLEVKLSLRGLLKLDWSKCRDYADYEVLLRRAKLLNWTEEDLEMRIQEREEERESILLLLKRNQKSKLLDLLQRYGPTWMLNQLTEGVVRTAHYKALKLMGYEPDRVAREMEVGWYQAKELEEAASSLTKEDLSILASRLIKLDRMAHRNRAMAVELLLLNTSIGFIRS